MSTTASAAPTGVATTLLRQFIALPRPRQLTMLRYCLEVYAEGVTPDGMVARGMCSEMEQMDRAWARKARRSRLFIVPNLGDEPDEPVDPGEARA